MVLNLLMFIIGPNTQQAKGKQKREWPGDESRVGAGEELGGVGVLESCLGDRYGRPWRGNPVCCLRARGAKGTGNRCHAQARQGLRRATMTSSHEPHAKDPV